MLSRDDIISKGDAEERFSAALIARRGIKQDPSRNPSRVSLDVNVTLLVIVPQNYSMSNGYLYCNNKRYVNDGGC